MYPHVFIIIIFFTNWTNGLTVCFNMKPSLKKNHDFSIWKGTASKHQSTGTHLKKEKLHVDKEQNRSE